MTEYRRRRRRETSHAIPNAEARTEYAQQHEQCFKHNILKKNMERTRLMAMEKKGGYWPK
jgi:hypothetical protein